MVSHNELLPSSPSESIKEEILRQKFPSFNCICELCDCGCVLRQRHSKTCKRQPQKVKRKSSHDKDCLMSHYQQTFKKFSEAERMLPMIPPRTPLDPNPPAMSFETTQKSDFVQRGAVEPTKLIKRKENYEPSTDQFSSATAYKESYPGYSALPRIQPAKGSPPQKTAVALAKFDPRTSHKEHFNWKAAKPVPSFSDLPSFAGSILFPGQKLGELQSTAHYDFAGHTAPKPEMMKVVDGNIKLEGEFDHQTVHKQTYTDMGPGHQSTKFNPFPQISKEKRDCFQGETQHMRDFPLHQSHPEPAQPADPPPATIRLSMDSRLDFTTENRTMFRGYDTKVHKKRDLIRKDNRTYEPPQTKFETRTSNKVDFVPVATEHLQPSPRRRPKTQTGLREARFDDRTTNKKFYKDWGVQPRVRFGDFKEDFYVAPMGKMESQSWNQSTYRPVKLDEPTKMLKPVEKPVTETGEHDFNTVHKTTYVGHKPKQCKAQLYLMQQELLRKSKRPVTMGSKTSTVTVKV